MLKQFTNASEGGRIIGNDLARYQDLLVWMVTVFLAIAGLRFLRGIIGYVLSKCYELFIQRNLFNL